MRNGMIELALVLVTTIATAGCADYSSGATVGTGGSLNAGGATPTGGSASTAIGGTGAGGATAVGSVTNISAIQVLGTLSAAQATQLCSDAYAYYGSAISHATTCKWKGLVFGVSSSAPTDEVLQANCATQESTCMQAGPANPSCGDLPSPCTATVAEYSTCIADQATVFAQTVSGLASCATVTHTDLEAVWAYSSAAMPASCQALDITCAGVDLPTPRY